MFSPCHAKVVVRVACLCSLAVLRLIELGVYLAFRFGLQPPVNLKNLTTVSSHGAAYSSYIPPEPAEDHYDDLLVQPTWQDCTYIAYTVFEIVTDVFLALFSWRTRADRNATASPEELEEGKSKSQEEKIKKRSCLKLFGIKLWKFLVLPVVWFFGHTPWILWMNGSSQNPTVVDVQLGIFFCTTVVFLVLSILTCYTNCACCRQRNDGTTELRTIPNGDLPDSPGSSVQTDRETDGFSLPREELQEQPRPQTPSIPRSLLTTTPVAGTTPLAADETTPPVDAETTPPVDAETIPPADEINPPSDEINPPSDEINPPSDEINPPSDEINPPADEINPPSGETDPTGAVTVPVVGETTPSADENILVGETTPLPGETIPNNEEITPAAAQTTPLAGETISAEDATTLAAGETTPPVVAENIPPADEINPPSDETAPPSDETAPPSGETTPPLGGTTPPSGETTSPSGGTIPVVAVTTSLPGETIPNNEETTSSAAETTPSPAETTSPSWSTTSTAQVPVTISADQETSLVAIDRTPPGFGRTTGLECHPSEYKFCQNCCQKQPKNSFKVYLTY